MSIDPPLAGARTPTGLKRQTVIESRSSWLPRFRSETQGYRDLFSSFVRRDVALRYKQTALGPIWVLLQPLLTAATFAFIFGSVANVKLDIDVPYLVYALVGMSLWSGLSQGLVRATSSLLGNVDLVTKVYFPRVLLPLSAATATAFDSLIIQGGLAVYLLVSGYGLEPQAVLVVPLTFIALTFAASVAAGLGALLVRYRDVQYGLPLIVQSMLLITPVLYPASAVSESVRWIVELNPLTAVFELLRWALLSSPAPSLGTMAWSFSVLAVVSVLACCIFARLERTFADVI